MSNKEYCLFCGHNGSIQCLTDCNSIDNNWYWFSIKRWAKIQLLWLWLDIKAFLDFYWDKDWWKGDTK